MRDIMSWGITGIAQLTAGILVECYPRILLVASQVFIELNVFMMMQIHCCAR